MASPIGRSKPIEDSASSQDHQPSHRLPYALTDTRSLSTAMMHIEKGVPGHPDLERYRLYLGPFGMALRCAPADIECPP